VLIKRETMFSPMIRFKEKDTLDAFKLMKEIKESITIDNISIMVLIKMLFEIVSVFTHVMTKIEEKSAMQLQKQTNIVKIIVIFLEDSKRLNRQSM